MEKLNEQYELEEMVAKKTRQNKMQINHDNNNDNGYDSDESDHYELFNKREARSKGLIGLPIDMIGKHMVREGGPNGELVHMQLRR